MAVARVWWMDATFALGLDGELARWRQVGDVALVAARRGWARRAGRFFEIDCVLALSACLRQVGPARWYPTGLVAGAHEGT
jgi:hypothetical protein